MIVEKPQKKKKKKTLKNNQTKVEKQLRGCYGKARYKRVKNPQTPSPKNPCGDCSSNNSCSQGFAVVLGTHRRHRLRRRRVPLRGSFSMIAFFFSLPASPQNKKNQQQQTQNHPTHLIDLKKVVLITPPGTLFPSASPCPVPWGSLSSPKSPGYPPGHRLYQTGENQTSPSQTEQRLWDFSFSPELSVYSNTKAKAQVLHPLKLSLIWFFPAQKRREISSPSLRRGRTRCRIPHPSSIPRGSLAGGTGLSLLRVS